MIRKIYWTDVYIRCQFAFRFSFFPSLVLWGVSSYFLGQIYFEDEVFRFQHEFSQWWRYLIDTSHRDGFWGYKQRFDDVFPLLGQHLFLAKYLFGWWMLLLCALLPFGYFIAKQRKDDAHLKGSQVHNEEQLNREVFRNRSNSEHDLSRPPRDVPKGIPLFRFGVGKVGFPLHFENTSLVVFGDAGSGKTVLLSQIMLGTRIWVKRVVSFKTLFQKEAIWLGIVGALLMSLWTLGLIWYLDNRISIIASVKNVFPEVPRIVLDFSWILMLLLILGVLKILTWKRVSFPGIEDQGGFIYDRVDLMSRFLKRSRKDIIFDPKDKRSARWNLFLDLKDDASIRAFCAGFFPLPGKGQSDEIWAKLPQQLLEAILRTVIGEAREKGKEHPNMADLRDFFLETDGDWQHLKERIKRFPQTFNLVSHILGTGKNLGETAMSAITSFGADAKVFCDPIWAIKPHPGQAEFSVLEFLNELKGSKKKKRWLFIRNSQSNADLYNKIYSAFFSLVFSKIVSFEEEQEWPRIQFVMDEWASLQKIESTKNLLNEGRKFGVFLVAMSQNPKQIVEKYGEEGASVLMSGFGSKLFFKQADEKSAEAASKLIGQAEVFQDQYGVNVNERQMAGGMNTSSSKTTKNTVLASELMVLQKREFYLNFPGFPWCKGKVPPIYYPKREEVAAFIPAEYQDEIFSLKAKDYGNQAPEEALTELQSTEDSPEESKNQPKAATEEQEPNDTPESSEETSLESQEAEETGMELPPEADSFDQNWEDFGEEDWEEMDADLPPMERVR